MPYDDAGVCDLPARAVAELVRRRDRTAVEVVRAYLDRAETEGRRLGAFVAICSDDALDRARALDRRLERRSDPPVAPLLGVPVTVKDTLDVRGMPTTAGTWGRRAAIATADATVVRRLRRAGAIVIAKTNVPELGLAWETDNRVAGRTLNPYDPTRTPGGSSGGEAAALAVNASALGVGSDSGGSLRVPAHYCGVASVKPTAGRVPRTGHVPPPSGASDAFMHVGPMARTVADCAVALRVLAGPDGIDLTTIRGPASPSTGPQLRIAIARSHVLRLSPEVDQAMRAVGTALADRGHVVEEREPSRLAEALEIHMRVTSPRGEVGIRELLAANGTAWEDRSPFIDRLLERTERYRTDPTDRPSVLESATAFRRHMAVFMRDWDVLVTPTTPDVAPRHSETFEADHWSGFALVTAHNLTGWPVVTVRAGWAGRLPVGVQVAALPWREDICFQVAAEIEAWEVGSPPRFGPGPGAGPTARAVRRGMSPAVGRCR